MSPGKSLKQTMHSSGSVGVGSLWSRLRKTTETTPTKETKTEIIMSFSLFERFWCTASFTVSLSFHNEIEKSNHFLLKLENEFFLFLFFFSCFFLSCLLLSFFLSFFLERDRDRETERDRDRETETETEIETQTDRQTDRQRHTDRQRERQRDRDRDRGRACVRLWVCAGAWVVSIYIYN